MPSERVIRDQFRVAILLIVVSRLAFSAEEAWENAARGLLAFEARTDEWRRHTPYANSPPPADAPLEVLAAWWARARLENDGARPTPETQKRLVEALRMEPQDLVGLIQFLPATPEVRAEI